MTCPQSACRVTTMLDFLLAVLASPSSHGRPSILDPKSYSSPSDAVVLTVDPSSPGGAGRADYVLRRGTTTLWQGEKPSTLWDAVVTDDGTTAGYAYSQGYNGGESDGDFHDSETDFDHLTQAPTSLDPAC